MRYLRTNEGLLTIKSERIYSKMIVDFEERLVSRGFRFRKGSTGILFGLRLVDQVKSIKDIIIKNNEYIIDYVNVEYLLRVSLCKNGKLGKPFVRAKIEGGSKTFEISIMEVTEDSSSVYELIDICRREIEDSGIRKASENSFYEDYPVDDIKDRLLDFTDEFSSTFKVSKIYNSGWGIDIDLSIKFIKNEYDDYIKVDEQMLVYNKVIAELIELGKVFNSMGLTLFYEPGYLIHGGNLSIKLYKTEES